MRPTNLLNYLTEVRVGIVGDVICFFFLNRSNAIFCNCMSKETKFVNSDDALCEVDSKSILSKSTKPLS